MANRRTISSCLFIFAITLAGCSKDVSERPSLNAFTSGVYRIIDTTDSHWHLWWQKGNTILREHSQGYVLIPIDPSKLFTGSYHAKPGNAHHISPANGALLKVTNIYEFGMQNPVIRATAYLKLKSGKTYPVEIFWYPGFENNLAPEASEKF